MHVCLFEDIAFDVVVENPAVIGADKESLVINIPQGPGGSLVGLAFALDNNLEISQLGNLLITFLILALKVKHGLEIIHLDARRCVRPVLIVEQQEPA